MVRKVNRIEGYVCLCIVWEVVKVLVLICVCTLIKKKCEKITWLTQGKTGEKEEKKIDGTNGNKIVRRIPIC